ncbi:hypothetical protein [Bradyrhizobium sp. HKCCYLR20261]|uniref:Cap15 family cyclic dinucleotide receptor domain-containing protein n=1 Tax=Bradyrhizobium sp. HKCCYLR20261 TaxID=3420760 RepID=UPI003EBCF724
MWALLARKTQVLIVVSLGIVAAWALEGVYSLVAGPSSLLHWLSLAAFIVGTVLTTAANVAWRFIWKRFPIIEKNTFPDLNGSWTGNFHSTWIDPETKQGIAPRPVTITIRQSLFATSVKLETGESTSHSSRCLLESVPEQRLFRIWYSYNNTPRAQVQHRSAPHEGVALLQMDYDANPNRLTGTYYTARKTTGDIDLIRNEAELCN